MDGRHVGLDFYDLLIDPLMRWTPTRCNWGSLASTRSRASRISAWKGIRFVLRHPSGRIGLAGGDESGQAASWLALSAVPKHRSRRLSPRIGQNLAQTIADGEIFTCS